MKTHRSDRFDEFLAVLRNVDSHQQIDRPKIEALLASDEKRKAITGNKP
ncbi:hypothetical protein [Xenorhabdus griffiniae]|uniref:Uncharacterized protein n=1 Tax=Xenorhabdus griffiniae TaxID=351672 RepID=A0ABY9XD74_9GAMM|nr:hypothetical protein [Xenorhabdus griffiniae]MBD1228084.1 hypothetical protein [Xenorhabdus griffiniae]MBE8587504.1 hypothetical protein [Xenorhabdus griffiniae]WMV70862.1 hypothetical protein QL128_11575 [Xenorhabdus griffiniae]WNH00538.1 hypothetical protein QL112_011580 [Xenorhabdus griffiniae]